MLELSTRIEDEAGGAEKVTFALSNERDPRLGVDVIVRLRTWFVLVNPDAEKSVLEFGVGV